MRAPWMRPRRAAAAALPQLVLEVRASSELEAPHEVMHRRRGAPSRTRRRKKKDVVWFAPQR